MGFDDFTRPRTRSPDYFGIADIGFEDEVYPDGDRGSGKEGVCGCYWLGCGFVGVRNDFTRPRTGSLGFEDFARERSEGAMRAWLFMAVDG